MHNSDNDNVDNGMSRSSADIADQLAGISRHIASREDYPETVEEVLDDKVKYRIGVIPALKVWKAKKLWGSKTNQQRLDGLIALANDLAPLYNIPVPLVTVDGIDPTATVRDTKMNDSGSSSYNRATHMITMRGNLSIITFLHEFGHSLGKGEQGACKWSINLFRKVFKKQYNKLTHNGHTLRRHRPDEAAISSALED